MKIIILLSLILITLLSGCTVEKRQHQKGFHVQWKHQSVAVQSSDKTTQKLVIKDEKKVVNKVESLESSTLEITTPNSQEVVNNINSNTLTTEEIKKKEVKTETKATPTSRYQTVRQHSFKREITGKKDKGDIWFLMTGIFLALGTWITFKTNRKRLNKVSKWAAQNPKKAQIAIAGLQIPLSAMALYAGFNLGKLGFEMSAVSSFSLAGIMAASLAAIPFLKKKNEFVLAKKLNKRRIGFFGIILSGTLMTANVGNHIANHQAAPFHETLNKVDKALFSDSAPVELIANSDKTKTSVTDDQTKYRKYLSGGLVFAGVLLFTLLIALFCAGLCGAFFSILFLLEGAAISLLFLALSVLIIIFTWKGMKALPKSKFFNEQKESEEVD